MTSFIASAGEASLSVHQITTDLLWIAIILIAAKVSSLVVRLGQPAVLGELLIGVIMGNLVLLGVNFFEPIKYDSIISFLAEFGVIILLFQIGLESKIERMKKVGRPAFLVAVSGVVVPFILGAYVVGPMLMPGFDANFYLFMGACLTATSVGITARVFKDPKVVRDVKAAIEGYDPDKKEHILSVIAPLARRHIEDLISPVQLLIVPPLLTYLIKVRKI